MKSYYKELLFEIKTRRAFVNITPEVEQCLAESLVQEGLCLKRQRLAGFPVSETYPMQE
jgi:thiamine phosphate synthase YjbQ (UPF0047 family)